MFGLIAVFSICFVGCEYSPAETEFSPAIPDEYMLQLYYDNAVGVLFCALSMAASAMSRSGTRMTIWQSSTSARKRCCATSFPARSPTAQGHPGRHR